MKDSELDEPGPEAGFCEICKKPGDWSSEMPFRVLCKEHDTARSAAMCNATDKWDDDHPQKYNFPQRSKKALEVLEEFLVKEKELDEGGL